MSIGTPDYTRGVVSAQKLLATVAAGTARVTVGVPPNAETLLVCCANGPSNGVLYVQGVTTLYLYAGVLFPEQQHIDTTTTWAFDVSSSMDEQVYVVFANAPTQEWFVYADAAVHVVGDASTLKNQNGAMYVIPSVPSGGAGDHPPNELSCTSNTFAAAGTLIPAPGAGQRIRLFAAQLMNYGTAGAWRLYDSSDTVTYLTCAESRSAELAYPLTGVTLPTNNALYCTLVTGGGSCRAMATYTVETV